MARLNDDCTQIEYCKCGAKLAWLRDEDGFYMECSSCEWYIALRTNLEMEEEFNMLLDTAIRIRVKEEGH